MFEAPAGYTLLGGKQRDSMREEEEDLLQFAIQQSLLEAGSEYDQVGPRPGELEPGSQPRLPPLPHQPPICSTLLSVLFCC